MRLYQAKYRDQSNLILLNWLWQVRGKKKITKHERKSINLVKCEVRCVCILSIIKFTYTKISTIHPLYYERSSDFVAHMMYTLRKNKKENIIDVITHTWQRRKVFGIDFPQDEFAPNYFHFETWKNARTINAAVTRTSAGKSPLKINWKSFRQKRENRRFYENTSTQPIYNGLF